MVTVVVAFAAGLLIGWNVLPQPAWVQKLWNKAEDKVDDIKEDLTKD